jgi:hypothetical protein
MASPRYAPFPIRCPECQSVETMQTSERMGETSHLCRDCDHVWDIVPVMTHSVERAVAALKTVGPKR